MKRTNEKRGQQKKEKHDNFGGNEKEQLRKYEKEREKRKES